MGESTAIGWTDDTFNPWWGCERVSPGCQNCYAESFAKRTGNIVWGKKADRRRFGEKHWAEPMKWQRQAEQSGQVRRVFCASMADVFEYRPDHHDDRQRLWLLIYNTPNLTWQLLTKRPENVRDMVPVSWLVDGWPHNVWIGTTCEDQERANLRVPVLLDIPARVRFLSCEPLLGPVTLAPWLHEGIGWVIVGGESGPKHRKLDLEDARVIRDECEEAGVPFFFKQVGGQFPTSGGDELDGVTHKQFPVFTATRKEGEPILAQHPDLADVVVPESVNSERTVRAFLVGAEGRYGATLALRPLALEDHTSIDPLTELRMMRPDLPIVAVVVDVDDEESS